MFRRVFLTVILLAPLFPLAGGGQGPPRFVTLEQALDLFARQSTALDIARADATRTAGLVRARAAAPNPIVGFTHEAVSDGPRSGGETYLTASQQLRWPGLSSAQGRAADHAASASSARIRADSLDLALEVKQRFVHAWVAERRQEVLRRLADVVRQAQERGEARLASGDLSGFDQRRLRLERARYDRLAAAGDQTVAETRRALSSAVLAPDDETLLAPAGLPEVGPTRPDAGGGTDVLDAHPASAVARAELALAEAEAAVEAAGRVPAPALTAAWKWQRDGMNGLLVGAALPVPLLDRRAAPVAAASARVDAAAARVGHVRRQIRDEEMAASERHARAVVQLESLRTWDLDHAADLLDIALASHAEGNLDVFGLLATVEAWRELGLLAAEVRAEYWLSRFGLERARGGALNGPAPSGEAPR